MSEPLSTQQIEQEISSHLKRIPTSLCDMILCYYGSDDLATDKLFMNVFKLPLLTQNKVWEFSGIFCDQCGLIRTKHCDARWFLERDWVEKEEKKCYAFVCVECDYDIFEWDTYHTCADHRLYDEETGQDLTMYVDCNYFSSQEYY